MSRRNHQVAVSLCVGAAFWASLPAGAHNGPPFPILEKRAAGPYVISVWTDPDVGKGSFYIYLEPVKGRPAAAPSKVILGVRPHSGRLPLSEYPAKLGPALGRTGYVAIADFDREETWQVRVRLSGPAGSGEAATEVEVTPQGPSRLEFGLYFLPFLAVGYLWIAAFLRSRRARVEESR